MEFEQVVFQRRSIRGFKSDPVPKALLERVLATASRAPSWSNVQGWRVNISAPAITQRIREALLARASGAYDKSGLPEPELPWLWDFQEPFKSRRRDCAKALYETMGIAYDDKPARANAMLRNFELFGAPHLAVLSAPKSLGEYGLVDLGCFLQTFLLALVDAGLGGIAQAAVASYASVLREHLDIPSDHRIVCGVSLGVPDPNAPANRLVTQRAKVDEFTRWEGF